MYLFNEKMMKVLGDLIDNYIVICAEKLYFGDDFISLKSDLKSKFGFVYEIKILK